MLHDFMGQPLFIRLCSILVLLYDNLTCSGVLGPGRIRTTKLDEAVGLAWFRYIDSKEYENTMSNKNNMIVKLEYDLV